MITHEDHGLTWERIGGKEIAAIGAHSLVVMRSPTTGYLWGVVDLVNDKTLSTGRSQTRAHARQDAVEALAGLAEVEVPRPIDQPDGMVLLHAVDHPTASPRMKVAAAALLAAIFGLMFVATVARCAI